MLITKRLAMIVTLKCTLNCKLCCNCVPLYKSTPYLDKELIANDLEQIFKIYDKVEWLQFVGGELFMHPDIGWIFNQAHRYEEKFDKIIIMTNGTIAPKQAELEIIAGFKDKIQVQISDYGDLSYKIAEFEKSLIEYQIPYVIKPFYGDIQHYGGWVDSGNFEYRNYSEEKVKRMFENCWQIGMENLHCYNGMLHNCIRSLFATDLQMQETPQDEYINLRDNKVSIEEKKRVASLFNTQPLTACQRCNGFDTENSKRYPAAEQV